ncbi:MAG: YqgE/AlgH family protein [Rhodospirillaceae bacterium]|nr:YqgE/AlgH family protein [Rhodospirillaceae bacterium]
MTSDPRKPPHKIPGEPDPGSDDAPPPRGPVRARAKGRLPTGAGPSVRNAAVDDSCYLTGQFLIAMPTMGDPNFERTLIYLCHHAAEGAMGLVVNKPMSDLKFVDILSQLDIERTAPCDRILVHRGGPVDRARGFVLHTADYDRQGTMKVDGDIALSATTEILRAIASGTGPRRSLMALGYAGWGGGQLDAEIKQNAWLSVPADDDILFSPDVGTKWERALAKLGVSAAVLSSTAGRA